MIELENAINQVQRMYTM